MLLFLINNQARIRDFLQGGWGWGQRRPCTAGAFGARADGGSRVDKHQIKVHSVWWSRAGGGGHDPPPPPGSALDNEQWVGPMPIFWLVL